ncbi:MAG: iron ABC transporter permease [Spirochaetales bacterium]|nr:iron ABC transporter permease [Spirochaetales bacterium]
MTSVKEKLIFLFLVIASVLLALSIGRYPLHPAEIIRALINPGEMDQTTGIILFNLRLPRILAAFFVGAALSLSGAVFQTIFKNPMVSPSVLGASSGAAFGAALAILLGLGQVFIQFFSFLTGLGAVMIAVLLSSMGKRKSRNLLLVLSGMLVNTFFTSLISLVKYVADPQNTLPTITYWLMGSLAESEMHKSIFMGVVVLLCGTLLYLMRWRIAALSLGEDEIRSLGIDPRVYRFIVIVCTTLLTSAAVSISGVIGWVGLVVPHIVRLWIPNNFSRMLWTSVFTGGLYLLLIDTVSRAITPLEFPLGILTSIIGAPFFAYFLLKES